MSKAKNLLLALLVLLSVPGYYGCSKDDDPSLAPKLQITRARLYIVMKNNNMKSPKNMYDGYVYYKSITGCYGSEKSFSMASFIKEQSVQIGDTPAPARGEIVFAPSVRKSFVVDESATYNPDLVAGVVVMALLSNGENIEKRITFPFTGAVSGKDLLNSYYESLTKRVAVDVFVNDNGEPEILLEIIPSN